MTEEKENVIPVTEKELKETQATLTGFDPESPRTAEALEVLERAKNQGMDVEWTVKHGPVNYEAGTPGQIEYMREQVAKWQIRET